MIGENAQGKTNLLEAIYVLALARSHRTNNDKELIRFGSDFARVSGQISRQSGTHQLELIISHQGKRARIDRIEQSKLSQYLGILMSFCLHRKIWRLSKAVRLGGGGLSTWNLAR